MEENGTYRWPGNDPKPPRKKPDFKKAGRTALLAVLALVVLTLAGN